MKKKIILCGILIIILIGTLFLIYDKKYIKSSKLKTNFSNVSFYVNDGSGYVKASSVPTGNYIVDDKKSYCEGNGYFSDYDSENGTIKYYLTGQDECVIYFDVAPVIANTFADEIIAKVSENDYTSSQDGTIYKVARETASSVDPNAEYAKLSQSEYGNVIEYKGTGTSTLTSAGTSTSGMFDYNPSDNTYTNDTTSMAPSSYYHMVVPVTENGYYQICYKVNSSASSNYLYAYVTDSGNTTTGTNKALIYMSSVGSTYTCTDLGYTTTSQAFRIVDRTYTSKASVTFYLQRTNQSVSADAGVRYEGLDPDNYITFNGETAGWRIIGVFEGSTIGLEPGKQYTKIIRNTRIGLYEWDEYQDGAYENDWTNSTLNTYLNGTYLSSMTDANKIAKYNGQYSTWHLRGTSNYTNLYSQDWYVTERYTGQAGYRGGTQYEADTETKGAIGIVYPSDYGYAAYGTSCDNNSSMTLYNYEGGCAAVDWLATDSINNTDWEWLISPRPDYSGIAFRVGVGGGYVDGDSGVYGASAVRPVLYLSSDVYVTGGDGSKTNPYTLGMEPPNLSEEILSMVSDNDYTSSQDGSIYRIKHEEVDAGNQVLDAGVRYEGKNPDNYIRFNNEQWRIIGVFEGSTIGLDSGKQYTKIIKSASTTGVWDTNNIHDWENATLKIYLNGDYYESLTEKDLVADATWYLKGYTDAAPFAHAMYHLERQNGYQVNIGNTARSTNIKAKVGLMYPSDYGMAAYGIACSSESFVSLSEYANGCAAVDWLAPNDIEFLITPGLAMETYVYGIIGLEGGFVAATLSAYANQTYRPTLYLESNVKIISGNGTQSDPYIIS